MDRKRKDEAGADEDAKRPLLEQMPHAEKDATPEPTLYCICRQELTDDERVMVACDRCDAWFHATCLHIPEEDVARIDEFVCPQCTPTKLAHSTYKPECAADGCAEGARLPLSRYCSDACGIRTVARRAQSVGSAERQCAQLASDAVTNADGRWGGAVWARDVQAADDDESPDAWLDRMRRAPRLAPVHAPEAGPSRGEQVRAQLGACVYVRTRPTAALAHVRAESAAGHGMLDVLAVRTKLLQLAEDRLSSLPVCTDTGHARCGFDARLAWDDEPLWAWATSSAGRAILQDEQPLDGAVEEGKPMSVICGESKRKCKRHADWSVLRGTEAEVARELQTVYVSALAEREQALLTALEKAVPT